MKSQQFCITIFRRLRNTLFLTWKQWVKRVAVAPVVSPRVIRFSGSKVIAFQLNSYD